MVAGIIYDISLEDTDNSNQTGLMIVRDRRLIRRFGLQDAQTIQERQLTMGEFTEAEADPKLRQFWTQANFRGGLGGVGFSADPFSYASGSKVTTAIDGILKLSHELKTTTVDTAPNEYVPSGFAEVGTERWAFVGRDVYQWNYTDMDWDIGTEPQASAVLYRNGVPLAGNTFAPCWNQSDDSPGRYIYKADADADWSLIDASTPNSFKYFARTINVNGEEILVGGYEGSNVHHIRTTTDPTSSTNWSGATEIGESHSPITALVEGQNNQVLVCKTNGIWSFSRSGLVENLTPGFTFQSHPDNFRGAHNWNGHILLPLGGEGLFELVSGRLYNVSLSLYAPRQEQFHGQVAAIHGTPDSLHLLVLDSDNTKYHLLVAEWAEVGDGPLDYHWHKEAEISYTTSTDFRHSALLSDGTPGPSNEVHNRIWAGVESTGSNLLPYFHPHHGDDEQGFTDDTDAEMVTVYDDRNFRRVDKTYAKVDFVYENLDSNNRIDVEYRLDGGSWQTDLAGGGAGSGAANRLDGSTGGASSTTHTLTFPSGTTGKILEFKFKPSKASINTTNPKLERFTVTSTLRPDPIKLMPLNIYLAENQLLYNGTTESKVKAKLSQLRTWDSQAAEVIVRYDEEEGSGEVNKEMVFLPGNFSVQHLSHENGRQSELIVSVLLVEV